MCDEYEKAKGVHSKEICQKIYKEALESAVSLHLMSFTQIIILHNHLSIPNTF